MAFDELGISAPVLRGLAESNFVRPAPIQAQAIPIAQLGVDLIAQAQSGTGKTCAFAVVALELLQPGAPAPQALIVEPTREIATQVRDVCRAVGAHVPGLSCHAFIGGTSTRADGELAQSCALACGTPGRIAALLLNETLIAAHVRLLVLDEADKLLEAGFESQLRYLLTALPPRKQTLAFSATFPPPLLAALKESMRAPHFLAVAPPDGAAAAADGDADGDQADALREAPWLRNVRQYYAVCGARAPHWAEHGGGDGGEEGGDDGDDGDGDDDDDAENGGGGGTRGGGGGGGARSGRGVARAKAAEVLRLLDGVTFHQALLFCNDRPQAAALAKRLCDGGYPAAFLSADLPQAERSALMRRMHSFQLRVLVATDLLARGVDFGRVSLVVQMQAPRDVATYLHRVGRTGRFGTVGLSVLLVADHEAAPALALLRGGGVEPRPLPRALDERDYLQRIESG